MKKILLFALVILSATRILSQEWTEPVQVSNSEGFHMEPDMCIDNNDIIHVVWSKRMTGKFWKIMYSNSSDNGETWSADYDISQNDTLWMSKPHIAFDSENNLYVTYDYDTYSPSKMLVYLQIFNEGLWNEPILVSEGMLGSDYNKLIVDKQDRIFVFWATEAIYDYYRIYDNGSWSEIMEPYFNNLSDLYFLYYPALDTNNRIHWIGYTTENMNLGDYAHAYFIYDYLFNNWIEPLNLTGNPALIGNDIGLNNTYSPILALREKTSNFQTFDGTYYMFNDEFQWISPELVVEDPYDQQIAVDQFNRPHIVNREKIASGWQLVHYTKINTDWIGNIVDTGFIVQRPNLLFHNNQLKMVYDKTWETIDDFIDEIMFTTYDISTRIDRPINNIHYFHIYPNPGQDQIIIEFEIIETGSVTMFISDFFGRKVKTLINKNMAIGSYQVYWNGKNENGVKVNSGLYLCRLYLERQVVSKSLEIIK